MYIYYIINNIYYTILSNIINSIITEKGYVKGLVRKFLIVLQETKQYFSQGFNDQTCRQ